MFKRMIKVWKYFVILDYINNINEIFLKSGVKIDINKNQFCVLFR